jgi:hypothetical protein
MKGGAVAEGLYTVDPAEPEAAARKIPAEELAVTTVAIVARHSGLVWDVEGASWNPGARIILWPWHGADNQRWRFVYLGAGAHYRLESFTTQVADVSGASQEPGTQFIQWPPYQDEPNQSFHIQHLEDSWYRFVALHSGQVADVSGGTLEPSPLIQWPWHGTFNQQFQFWYL